MNTATLNMITTTQHTYSDETRKKAERILEIARRDGFCKIKTGMHIFAAPFVESELGDWNTYDGKPTINFGDYPFWLIVDSEKKPLGVRSANTICLIKAIEA